MTLADIYARFERDCDKGSVHSYIDVYERLLAPYRELATTGPYAQRPRQILEVGIFKGGSLRMFEQYFALGFVHGMDLCDQPLGLADLRPMIAEAKHSIKLGDAADPKDMERLFFDATFDVVIEDASHAVSQQVAIYRNLRPRMRPGSLYVIEDIENIERDRAVFEQLDPTASVEILDLRHIKRRFDDVLVIVRIPQ